MLWSEKPTGILNFSFNAGIDDRFREMIGAGYDAVHCNRKICFAPYFFKVLIAYEIFWNVSAPVDTIIGLFVPARNFSKDKWLI